MNTPADPAKTRLTQARLRQLLLDEQLQEARETYSQTISATLTEIEGWLALDSWLGGGTATLTGPDQPPSDEAVAAFRGVATVLCMASELAEAAVIMTSRRRTYAAAAVLRQLIECEYLFALFGQDIDHAATWIISTPAQIRQTFTPAKMRQRTAAFSSQEYWSHCDSGGHPAPKGARLLQALDPTHETWPYQAAELTFDIGLHLQRVWRAADRVLATHHARYATVRGVDRQSAIDAWSTWEAADPLLTMIPSLIAIRRQT